ncbi:MAG: EAL domain-containing protein [Pseudomonadales bacterium]
MVINKYTENVVDLLRNAVSACQMAKDNGGNRVHIFRYDVDLHDRREKLLSWIDKLNNVLSSDKLALRGQMISPLNAVDKHSHYEILLAIKTDDGELTSPVEFIEAAECYNRMQRVDRWVIEHTFQWLCMQMHSKMELSYVSINLSGNSLNDDLFMDFILEQFAKYKVPTNIVCFEVTETATINNLAEAADFIREIKKIGCHFSLDDFGSGNASYQYLKHLPVDYLKIDGMLVREIDKK